MGMQVSCGVHPEVSTQGDVWVDTQRTWADHAGVSTTERERGGGGASDGRSCSHDVVDPAEVFGIRGGGVHQGEECDSDCTKIYGSDEELCWVDFWARGYYVSTVGRDEAQVRNYIREQEKEDRRLDQLKMFE